MFAENLKKIRKELHLSVDKMSETLGIPASTLWGYEGNKRTPSIELPIQLYRKYNVNTNWFLTGEGEMFNSTNFENVKTEVFQQVESILAKYGIKTKDS